MPRDRSRRTDVEVSRPGLGRRVLATSALALTGTLVALMLLELILQTGAYVGRLTGRHVAAGWQLDGHRRLLALGDSNTYGVWVAPENAYPAQLESLWNRAKHEPPLEVLNLGYPGMNSSNVRKRLPRLLAILRPDIVTVMIGSNDFWTSPEAPDGDRGARLDAALWQWSRAYRLLALVYRAFRAPKVTPRSPGFVAPEKTAVEWRGERVEMPDVTVTKVPDWRQRLRDDLKSIAAQVHASGADVIFLTYPADPLSSIYAQANGIVRQEAENLRVRLIDLGARIGPRCPKLPCAEFLPDHHPTAEGHRQVAEVLVEELSRPSH